MCVVHISSRRRPLPNILFCPVRLSDECNPLDGLPADARYIYIYTHASDAAARTVCQTWLNERIIIILFYICTHTSIPSSIICVWLLHILCGCICICSGVLSTFSPGMVENISKKHTRTKKETGGLSCTYNTDYKIIAKYSCKNIKLIEYNGTGLHGTSGLVLASKIIF